MGGEVGARCAYDLCDARMMEFLLATRPMAFELERFHLCITDGRSRWSPDDFKGRMVWLGNFLDRWPRHLVDRLAPRRASVAAAGSNWGAGA